MSKEDIIRELNNQVAKAHEEGDWDTVLSGLDAILAIDPNNYEALSDKGGALGLMGRAEESIEYLEKAIKLNPNDEHIWSNLGCAHSRLENIDKAVEAFNRSLAINPDNRVTAFNKMLALAIKAEKEKER